MVIVPVVQVQGETCLICILGKRKYTPYKSVSAGVEGQTRKCLVTKQKLYTLHLRSKNKDICFAWLVEGVKRRLSPLW